MEKEKNLYSNFYLERKGNPYCIRLKKGINSIGRFPSNSIRLVNTTFCSRKHCTLTIEKDKVVISDSSFNGTFLNEEKLHNSSKEIINGTKIGIGVNNVDNEVFQNSSYHVYVLRKIPETLDEIINMPIQITKIPQIIDLLDDSDDESLSAIKEKELSLRKNNEVIHNLRKKSKSASEYLLDKDVKVEVEDIKIEEPLMFELLGFSNSVKLNTKDQHYVDDIDEEEFFQSQIYLTEIKQEVNYCDYDEPIVVNELVDESYGEPIDNNNPVEYNPIIEISDDENDEQLDGTTTSWFLKLSQNFTDNKNKSDFENVIELSDNEAKIISHTRSNKKEKKSNIEDTVSTTIDKLVNKTLDQKVKHNKTITKTQKNSKRSDKKIEKLECVKSISREHKIKECTEKIRIVETKSIPIIEPPQLPKHKGKLRGVAASNNKLTNNSFSIIKAKHEPAESLKRKNNYEAHTESKKIKLNVKSKVTKMNRGDFLLEDIKKSVLSNKKNQDFDAVIENNEKFDKARPNLVQTLRKRGKSVGLDPKKNQKFDEVVEKKINEVKSNLDQTLQKRRRSMIMDTNVIIKKSVLSNKKNQDFDAVIENNDKFDKAGPNLVQTRRKRGKSVGLDPKKNQKFDEVVENKTKFNEVKSNLDQTLQKRRMSMLMDTNPKIEEETAKDNRPEKLTFSSVERFHRISISSCNFHQHYTDCRKEIVSILKQKKYEYKKHSKKKVTFNEDPKTYTYESEANYIELKKVGTKKDVDFQYLNYIEKPNINSSDTKILAEILSWKPEWLNNNNSQNVNRPDELIPMLHHYQSYERYSKIMRPLMKLEFWVRLERDLKLSDNKFVQLVFNDYKVENIKDGEKKILYYCEHLSNKKYFFQSDLILIKLQQSHQVFGHIRSVCFKDSSTKIFFAIVIETNFDEKIETKLSEKKKTRLMEILKLTEIRIELGAFNALQSLKISPMLDMVLNPNIITNSSEKDYNRASYKGYDKLNAVQEKILMKTYLQIVDKKPTIQLIEGPPGTGKSCLIANLILQIIYGKESRFEKKRILVVAHSNIAIDIIANKLINVRRKMEKKIRFGVIRFGNVDRMNKSVKGISLSSLINSNANNKDEIKDEINFLQKEIELFQKNNINGINDNKITALTNNLRRFTENEKQLYPTFLKNANVICTTVSSCVTLWSYVQNFDVCILDEATQCNEPWSLIPIQFGINSYVLVGDTNQLPATCISPWTKNYNYGKSMFTRFQECIQHDVHEKIMRLKIQYRMHPEICKFPNSYFYQNSLENHDRTSDFKVMIKPYSIFSLDYVQNRSLDNGKISNKLEADFVVRLIKSLSKLMPIKQFSYGIITPYATHRDYIGKKLKESHIKHIEYLEVNTVDAYQGKEKDIIIISNARTEGVGFLRDPCRLNVALTRARKCLILCGNFIKLQDIECWTALLKDAKERKLYHEFTSDVMQNFEANVMSKLKV